MTETSIAHYRRGEKYDGEWHLPIEGQAFFDGDVGHRPVWSSWVPVISTPNDEGRTCLVDGCDLADFRMSTAIDQAVLEDRGVEVIVGGRVIDPYAPPPSCLHRTFNQQTIVVNQFDDSSDGDPTRHVGWQVRVKLRCAECGMPFVFQGDTARTSEDRLTLAAQTVPKDDSMPPVGEIGWAPAAIEAGSTRI